LLIFLFARFEQDIPLPAADVVRGLALYLSRDIVSEYDPWLRFRGSLKGDRFCVTRTPFGIHLNPLSFRGVIEPNGSGARIKVTLSYPRLWLSLLIYAAIVAFVLYKRGWDYANPCFIEGLAGISLVMYLFALLGFWWGLAVQTHDLIRIFQSLGAKLAAHDARRP
jgi:hypothetical protein